MKRQLRWTLLGVSLAAAPGQAQEQLFPGRFGAVERAEVELPGLGKQLVEYTVIDGYHVFQGDIILKDPDAPAQPAPKAAVRTQSRWAWPRGVVPYVIDEGFDATMRARIQQAVDTWNNNSIIRVRPRRATGDPDWVVFTRGSGCASPVGRQGGLQRTFLGNCSVGAIIHEIGHVVGLFHENMRADRDANVDVHWQNIIPEARSNFLTYVERGEDGGDFGVFDFDSIMMYGSLFFSWNGQPTLTRKDGTRFEAQRDHLSGGDLAGVRQMYYALTFQGWQDLPEISTMLPLFSPALTSWGNDHLALFMVAEDSQMWVASFNGSSWSGWSPLGGQFLSGPAATSRGPGLLDVIGKGLDHQYWINSFNVNANPQWTGWNPIPDGSFLQGPGAAAPYSNVVDVFGTGFDEQLWVNTLRDGMWTGWSPLGGVLTSSPSAHRACVLFFCFSGVAVRGTDNKIWTGVKFFDGQWSGFGQIPGDETFLSGPAEVGRAVVAAIGHDTNIYVSNSDGGPWTSWKPLRGSFFDSRFNPTGVQWPSGKVHVLAVGSDTHFKINVNDRMRF